MRYSIATIGSRVRIRFWRHSPVAVFLTALVVCEAVGAVGLLWAIAESVEPWTPFSTGRLLGGIALAAFPVAMLVALAWTRSSRVDVFVSESGITISRRRMKLDVRIEVYESKTWEDAEPGYDTYPGRRAGWKTEAGLSVGDVRIPLEESFVEGPRETEPRLSLVSAPKALEIVRAVVSSVTASAGAGSLSQPTIADVSRGNVSLPAAKGALTKDV